MDIVSLVALVALVKKLGDFSTYVTNKVWKSVIAQVWYWAVGAGIAYAATQATAFKDLEIVSGNQTLGSLNVWAAILVGLSWASIAGTAVDFLKARDNTQSAAFPPLVPGSDDSE